MRVRAAAATGVVLLSCSVLTDLGGLGADAGGTDAGDAAAFDATDAQPTPAFCGSALHGPQMIDAGAYCIDSTEVTQGQYLEFLNAKKGDTSGQSGECASWNTAWASNCPASFDPVSHADWPMIGVDWCDARGYCEWAGKRLCGKLGGGGSVSGLPYQQSEWFDGCTNRNDGLHKYPYGLTFDASACNGADVDAGGPVAVGSMPGCQGGLPGLFDMLGNVEEWVDDCGDASAQPETETCHLHGGEYVNSLANTECTTVTDSVFRESAFCYAGIRCCASPAPK